MAKSRSLFFRTLLGSASKRRSRREFRNTLLENLEPRRLLAADIAADFGTVELYRNVLTSDKLVESAAQESAVFLNHKALHFQSDNARRVSLSYGPAAEDTADFFYEYPTQRLSLRSELPTQLSESQIEKMQILTSGEELFVVGPHIRDGQLEFAVSGKPGLRASQTIWLTPEDQTMPIYALDVYVRNEGDLVDELVDEVIEVEAEGEGSGSGSSSWSSSSGSSSSSGGPSCPPELVVCQESESPRRTSGKPNILRDDKAEAVYLSVGSKPDPVDGYTLEFFADDDQLDAFLTEHAFSANFVEHTVPTELVGVGHFSVVSEMGPYLDEQIVDWRFFFELKSEVPASASGEAFVMEFEQEGQQFCAYGAEAGCSGSIVTRRGEVHVVPTFVAPSRTQDSLAFSLVEENGKQSGVIKWTDALDFGDLPGYKINLENTFLHIPNTETGFLGESYSRGAIHLETTTVHLLPEGYYPGSLKLSFSAGSYNFFRGFPVDAAGNWVPQNSGHPQENPYSPLNSTRIAGRMSGSGGITYDGNGRYSAITESFMDTWDNRWYSSGFLPYWSFWLGNHPPSYLYQFEVEIPLLMTVGNPTENAAPVITSTPVTKVLHDAIYRYDVDAVDDGAITYQLMNAPTGMTIDSSSGLITWQATADTSRYHTVTVRATDGFNLYDEQTYVIEVIKNNLPPIFESQGPTDAYLGKEYEYAVVAFDPDGDDVRLNVLQPIGASFDPNDQSRLLWQPSQADIETNVEFVIQARDEFGASTTQNYEVFVHGNPENSPPVITSTPRIRIESAASGMESLGSVVVTSPTAQAGSDRLQFVLDDGQTASGSVDFSLGSAPPMVDVMFLLDDTGSFLNLNQFMVDNLGTLLDTLYDTSGAFKDSSIGVGLSRFEDFPVDAYYDLPGYGEERVPRNRPFQLIQPVLDPDYPRLREVLDSALRRTTPGAGGGLKGDPPVESLIEALYQVATGAGWNGASTDPNDSDTSTNTSQQPGNLSSQLTPDENRDVPSPFYNPTKGFRTDPEYEAGYRIIRVGDQPHVPIDRDMLGRFDGSLEGTVYQYDASSGNGLSITIDSHAEDLVSIFSPSGAKLIPTSTVSGADQVLDFVFYESGTHAIVFDRNPSESTTHYRGFDDHPTYVEPQPEEILFPDFSFYVQETTSQATPDLSNSIAVELGRRTSVNFAPSGGQEEEILYKYELQEPGLLLLDQVLFPGQWHPDPSWELLDEFGHPVRWGSSIINDTRPFNPVTQAARLGLVLDAGQPNPASPNGLDTHAGGGELPAGTYYLRLKSTVAGSFDLQLTNLADAQGVTLGSTWNPRPTDISQYRLLAFTGQIGQQIKLDFQNFNLPPNYSLIGPDGGILFSTADSLFYDDLEITLPLDGSYYIVMESTFSNNQSGVGTINTTIEGRLSRPGFLNKEPEFGGPQKVVIRDTLSERSFVDSAQGEQIYIDGLDATGRARIDFFRGDQELAFSLINSEFNRMLPQSQFDETLYFQLEPIDLLAPVSSSRIGGGGFRPGALPVIIAATDTGTRYRPEFEGIGCAIIDVEGVNGTDQIHNIVGQSFQSLEPPLCQAANLPDYDNLTNYFAEPIAPQSSASVQDAIEELVNIGALVVGVGPNFIKDGNQKYEAPGAPLEHIAKLTGAINGTSSAINNNIPNDDIAPGEPLFVSLDAYWDDNTNSWFANADGAALMADIEHAISSALTSVAYDVEVILKDENGSPVTWAAVTSGQSFNIAPGTSTFQQVDFQFTGDGGAHSTYAEFRRKGTEVVLGRIPLGLNYSYSYDVNAIDADGDLIEYSLVGENYGATINSTTGEISWLPPAPDPNNPQTEFHFTVRASDGNGGFDTQVWTVEIEPLNANNSAPTIEPINDQTATKGRAFELVVEANDVDGHELEYVLVEESGVSVVPEGMQLIGSTIYWMPQASHVGLNFDIQVSVNDGRGGVAAEVFSINVESDATYRNRRPEILSSPPKLAITGEHYRYKVQVQDADNDFLTLTIPDAPQGMVVDSLTKTISWTPREADIGEHTVLLVVTDGQGGSAAQRYALRVSTANVPPAFTSTPVLQYGLDQAGPWVYNVTADDANGDDVSIALAQGPEGMTLNAANSLVWNPTNAGFYNVELVATDQRGGKTTQAFTVHIVTLSIGAPVVTSQPQGPAYIGTEWTYDFYVTRDAAYDIQFELISGPSGMHIVPDLANNKATLKWTPASQGGNYKVHVWASYIADPTIGAGQVFELPITFANRVPIIRSIPYDAMVGNPWTYQLDAVDPDGHELEYELLIAQPGMTIDEDGLVTWTPNYVDFNLGEYEAFGSEPIAKIAVRDGFGGEVIDEIFASIEPPIYHGLPANSPFRDVPFVRNNPTGPIYFDEPWTHQLDGIDPIGDSANLYYEFVDLLFNGSPVSPADRGSVTFSTTQPGLVTIVKSPDANPPNSLYEYVFHIKRSPNAPLTETREYRMQMRINEPNDIWPVFTSQPVSPPISDGSTWNHTLETDPAGATFGKTTDSVGTVSGTTASFSTSALGTFPFVATATNGATDANNNPIEFRQATTLVAASNSLIQSMPEVAVRLESGAEYKYQVQTSGSSSVFEIVEGPAGMTIDIDGLLQWEPTEIGNYPIKIRVTDGGTVANQEWIVSAVKPFLLNEAPIIVSTPIQVAERDVAYEYQVNAEDANGDTLEYILEDDFGWMSINTATGLITGTPTKAGIHNVIVTVREVHATEHTELESQQSFTLYVLHNAKPRITSQPTGNQWFTIGSTEYVYAPFEFNDPNDEDISTLTVEMVNGPFDFTFDDSDPNNQQLRFSLPSTHTYLRGRHDVTVRVTDQFGGYDEQTFHVQALIPNSDAAPVITSQLRTTLVAQWPYELQLVATDADGDDVTFSSVLMPPGANLTSDGLFTWDPPNDLIDDDPFPTVQFTASSARDSKTSATFSQAVDIVGTPQNDAPQIVSTPITTATAYFPYEYSLQATDGDNDVSLWTLDRGPRGMSLDQISGGLHWNPTKEDVGVHVVRISASDGYGGLDSQQFELSVLSHNLAPQIKSIFPQFVPNGGLYTTTIQAEDPENNPLYFRFTNDVIEVDYSTGIAWSKLVWDPNNPNDFIRVDTETGYVEWNNQDAHGTTRAGTLTVVDGRDGRASIDFAMTSFDSQTNSPPTISGSLPQYLGLKDSLTSYAIAVSDPDLDTLQYSLKSEPEGLTIPDPSIASIQWDPSTTPSPGEYFVTFRAWESNTSDGFMVTKTERVVVVDNDPPSLVPLEDVTITSGAVLRTRAVATDPNNDPVIYSAIAIDNNDPSNPPTEHEVPINEVTGEITWPVLPTSVSTWTITITAADVPYSSTDSTSFTVTTTSDVDSPDVKILFQPAQVEVGQDVTITVAATDNAVVDFSTLTLTRTTGGASESISLDSNGTAYLKAADYSWLTTPGGGTESFLATATDVSGNTGSSPVHYLQVVDGPPNIEIKSPKYNEEVYDLVRVYGSIFDPQNQLASYRIEVFPQHEPDHIITVKDVPNGASDINDGVIATFDPTVLDNGIYTLVVTASDTQGNQSTKTVPISLEGNYKPGVLSLAFTDLEIPTPDIPLTVTRRYSSTNANVEGDFGYGWSLELGIPEIEVAAQPNAYATRYGRPVLLRGTRVIVTLPDGTREGFTFEPIPERENAIGLVLSWLPYFHPDEGNTSFLAAKQHTLHLQKRADGTEEFVDFVTRESYHPATPTFGGYWKVQMQAGPEIYIDGNLEKTGWLEDRNGNRTTINPSGITHWSGKSVRIVRDSSGRVLEVYDPAGSKIQYSYQNGLLTQITDRLLSTTKFEYGDLLDDGSAADPAHQNFLTKILDGHDRIQLTAEYNDSDRAEYSSNTTDLEYLSARSRLSKLTDVSGQSNNFNFDLSNRSQGITSNNGASTVVVDRRGNPIETIDPEGVTGKNKYNQDGNLIEQRQVVGETDGRSGILDDLVTHYEYNQYGQPVLVSDTAGQQTSYSYNSDHLVSSVVSPTGLATRYSYDKKGNLTIAHSPLGEQTKMSYGYRGQLSRVANEDGLELVNQEYDYRGNLVSTTDADGNVTEFEYENANGLQSARVTKRLDESGNVLFEAREETVYDVLDRPTIRRLYHDGVLQWETETSFNPNTGLVIWERDQKGLLTYFKYDQRGNTIETRREVKILDALGSPISTWSAQRSVYDDEGRIAWSSDSYEADSAGEPIAGNWSGIGASQSIYNAAGRPIESKRWLAVPILLTSETYDYTSVANENANGAALITTTATEYDSVGRAIRTRDANGLWTETFYGFSGEVVQTRSEVIDEFGELRHLVTRSVNDGLGRPLMTGSAYLEPSHSEVSIVNASFESPSLSDDATSSTVPGWTTTGSAVAWNPLAEDLAGVTGDNVGEADVGTFSQVLSESLQPNRKYQLFVDVGNRSDVAGFSDYSIGLYAGGQLLEEVTHSDFAPSEGKFVTASLQYQSESEVDDGRLLEIRLTSDSSTNVSFDNVRLTKYRNDPDTTRATKNYYDSFGRTVKVEQRDGVKFALLDREGAEVYDYSNAKGPFSVRLDDQGSVLSTSESFYNDKGQLTRALSSTGAETRYEYDERGRQIRQIGTPLTTLDDKDLIRHITETEYDELGRAYKTWTNIRGRDLDDKVLLDRRFAVETLNEYDEQGRVIRTTIGKGTTGEQLTEFAYDLFGNVVSETDGSGQAKLFEYDAGGRLAAVELPEVADPANANALTRPRFEYGYDWSGNQTSILDSLGRETTFTFDEAGRQQTRTLPEGNVESFTYNERGQQQTHTSFEGVVTEFVYDNGTTHLDANDPAYTVGSGRLVEQRFYADVATYANGAGTPSEVWKFTYNALGRKTQFEALAGTSSTRIEQWFYDDSGRVIQAASPEGVINYAYDAVTGQMTRMWTTKAAGLDAANLADAVEDTHYSYNQLGWLTEVTVVEKNDVPLDVTGATTTTDDDPALTIYGYDLQGRQRRIDNPNGNVQTTDVDALGQITHSRIYAPDETPYDLGDNAIVADFEYELTDGQPTRLTETFYFDDDNDPNTPDVAQTTVYDWAYDANDRLVSEAIDHFEDDLDRTESFVMDLFGNRLQRTVDYDAGSTLSDQVFAYSYDDNDRLLSETLDELSTGVGVDRTTTYDWGAGIGGTQQLGKSVSGGVSQSFSYDLQGRLASVVTTPASGSMTRVDYDYDSSGIRISATEFTDANDNQSFETAELQQTTEYLIDHRNHTGYAQTIVETTKDASGQTTKRITYTFGTDEITQTVTDYVAGVAQTPVVHTFGHDAHGSVRVLLDAAGAISQAYTYAAYGELLAIHNATGASVGTAGSPGLESQTLTNLLYSGESFDSRIGQQYLRARWYDMAAGRFSRLDPYFGNASDPLSFNKYLYAHSNPIVGIDPTGRNFSIGGLLSGISIRAQTFAVQSMSVHAAFWAINPAIASIFIHDEIVGVMSSVYQLMTGRDTDDQPLTLAGYLLHAGLLSLQFLPGESDAIARSAVAKIGDFRRSIGYAVEYTGHRAADNVVALLRINGKDYLSQNGWISASGQKMKDVLDSLEILNVYPNRFSITHAEGGVFYQAIKDGQAAHTAEIFVDSTFCTPCGQGRGLLQLAETLGLKRLIVNVRLANGHWVKGDYWLK